MKDRKTLPKTALPRIYFIDREIASGKYPNTKTLAEDYETGTATISRDIEFMRDMLNAPIEYDYTQKGYYYTEKTFRLPAAFSSAEDMLALGMTKNILSLYKNTPIYDAANQFMESITSPIGDGENSRWHEDRIIVPPIPSIKISTEIWNNICEGLRKNRVLQYEYRSSWTGGYTVRRVHPYQLLFDNGAWYLYAYSIENKSIRTFSLSRIKNIIVNKETFTFPKSADFRRINDNSYFGAYSEEKKRRYKIAFFNDGAMRVKDRLWTADQKIEETAEGLILSFTSTQYGKVLELVLANGKDVLPLEPAELVKDWKEHIQEIQKRAKSIGV